MGRNASLVLEPTRYSKGTKRREVKDVCVRGGCDEGIWLQQEEQEGRHLTDAAVHCDVHTLFSHITADAHKHTCSRTYTNTHTYTPRGDMAGGIHIDKQGTHTHLRIIQASRLALLPANWSLSTSRPRLWTGFSFPSAATSRLQVRCRSASRTSAKWCWALAPLLSRGNRSA